jgi:mono/diheme cytochrome c family protein
MRTRCQWAIVLSLSLVSCSSSKNSSNLGEASGATCPADSTLTHETFGKQFMTNYCVRCHSSTLSGTARQGAPSDHNLDTLVGVHAADLEHIDESAAAGPQHTNTAMPPSDPRPSLQERQNLGEWLARGAQ